MRKTVNDTVHEGPGCFTDFRQFPPFHVVAVSGMIRAAMNSLSGCVPSLVMEAVQQCQPAMIWLDTGLRQVVGPDYRRPMFADYHNRS